MGNSIKRFLALALAVFMVIGMMPTNIAFATEAGEDEIPVCEHTYVGGICEQCGEPEPQEEENPAPTESEPVEDPYAGVEQIADDGDETTNAVAKIGEQTFETLQAAFAAAVEGETITLLADATPALTSQRAITKAAVIDLNGKTLTLTEDDLYFGTTTFENGTIVVDPSVKPSTAVFWMFANQTLTFDNVKIVATGVTGTYLIGLEGVGSDLNLLNGSEILIENTTALDLDVICVNGSTDNDIVIQNSKVNVTNLDGRVFFRGNYTVSGTSDINLSGITKAGFRIEAGQTLSIEDTAKVVITGEPRDGGIHLTDVTATYTKADTATVNATLNEPNPAEGMAAKIGETPYASLVDAIAAVQDGQTITLLADCGENVTVTQKPDVKFTIDGKGNKMTGAMTVNGASEAYANAGVTIQNFNFDATGIAADACINLGDGSNTSRYTSNVTVEDCSFTGGNKEKAAIKSYTGGDKNLTVIGCTVDNTMHSLLQAANIAGIVIDKCTVNSKNGINLNSSSNVEIMNTKVSVSGYAVRIGVNGGTSGKVTLTNNTLETSGNDDAVVVLRGTAPAQVDLAMSKNVVSGATHISGTTAETTIDADGNYWDGKNAPVVAEGSTAVEVDTYYKDEALNQLVDISNIAGSGT